MIYITSYKEKLIEEIETIEALILQFLDCATLHYLPHDKSDNYILLGFPEYHWGKVDERAQIILRERYIKFYQKFCLLLHLANEGRKYSISESHNWMLDLIEQRNAPGSIEIAKKAAKHGLERFKEFLELISLTQTDTILILDTNSILSHPNFSDYKKMSGNPEFSIFILPTVLDELDKLKALHRDDKVREKAKGAIKRLKGYRNQGNLLEGVKIDRTIKVKMIATEPNFANTPAWLDRNNSDDRIIASCLQNQVENPSSKVVVVTSDLNLQNKAQMASLNYLDPEDYLE